jgi:hypothetical protein
MGRRKKQYPASDFINAIPGTGGIIATIAKRVGCDWWTAKRAIDRYPSVKAAYEAECETVNDLAESTLIKSIKDGDVAAAKWWLTKKRKATFGDALDLTSGGDKLSIVVSWDALNNGADEDSND